MKRFLAVLGFLGAWTVAQAQNLELGFSYGSQPFSVNLALTNLVVLENPELSVEFAASNRRVQAGVQSALEFAPIGRATAYARFGVAYAGGVRFEAAARGAIGPVALELAVTAWSATSSAFNPVAPFAWNPDPITDGGFYFAGQGTYRLSRTLFLTAGGRYGSAQSRLFTGLENRAGDWNYGGNLLLAWQSNGLTYGLNPTVRWSPASQPFSLEAQGFVGINETVGFGFGGAGLNFNYRFEDLGLFNAFVIYEIWRLDVLPFRFGANLELNVGPGVAVAQGYGGADINWAFGWGLRVAYRVDLGALFNP